jgi:hypothetical protein
VLRSSDDDGYFGGDGAMPSNAKNFLEADFRKPIHLIQPKHRGLNHEDEVDINLAEAKDGFEASKRRNAGSVLLG